MVHAKQQGLIGAAAWFHMRSQFCPDQAAEQQFFGQRRKNHRVTRSCSAMDVPYTASLNCPTRRQREKKLQEHIQDQVAPLPGLQKHPGSKDLAHCAWPVHSHCPYAVSGLCSSRLSVAWYLARPGIPLSDIHLQFFPVCRAYRNGSARSAPPPVSKQRILCTGAKEYTQAEASVQSSKR